MASNELFDQFGNVVEITANYGGIAGQAAESTAKALSDLTIATRIYNDDVLESFSYGALKTFDGVSEFGRFLKTTSDILGPYVATLDTLQRVAATAQANGAGSARPVWGLGRRRGHDGRGCRAI